MSPHSPPPMAATIGDGMHLLGTSGTVTTIAGVYLGCRATTAAASMAAG